MPYPKFFPLKKCPGASVPAQANGTCPRQQGAPEAEVRATRGGGSTPTSAGCGCGGCGAPESPGEHVRHDAPGRTDTQPGPYRALFGARTQTHPEGRGPRWVSVRRPGAGGSATPPPQAVTGRGVRAGEQGRRGEGAQPGDLCGDQPARPKAPRAGGRDRGRPQEAPPTCPPCALRHQAGTGTLGRSRLEGLALQRSAGSRTSHSAAGGWLSRGPLAGLWELGVPVRRLYLAVNSPSCARRPPLLRLPGAQPSDGRRREGGRKFSQPLGSSFRPAPQSLLCRTPSGSPLRALA